MGIASSCSEKFVLLKNLLTPSQLLRAVGSIKVSDFVGIVIVGDSRSAREEFSGEGRFELSPLFASFVSSHISLLIQLAVELDELEDGGA